MAYEKQKEDELILRDRLAVERTKLAEERTTLAYIRTGMSIMLAGFFFMGYFTQGAFHYLGYATVAVASTFLAYGFYHHKKSMKFLEKLTLGMIKFNGDD